MAATRTETDSFGPLEVAADRYWGAQTQRSIQNFPDRLGAAAGGDACARSGSSSRPPPR